MLFIIRTVWLWAHTETTDNAYTEADISLVNTEVNGVIDKVYIAENSLVKAGDIIATIGDIDYKMKLEKINANLSIGEAKIEELNKKITIAKIALDKLKERVALSQKEYEHASSLRDKNFGSQHNLDIAKESYAQAKFDLETNQENFALANIEKDIQEKNLISLRADKLLAEKDLENTKIKAPIDGVLANSLLRIGNYVRIGTPVCSIVPMNIYIKANFKETQITKFKVGMKVDLQFDYLPRKVYTGTIRSIAPATGSKFSLLPLDNATGNFTKIVQRVTVVIDIDKLNKVKSLKPGMSVRTKILTTQ